MFNSVPPNDDNLYDFMETVSCWVLAAYCVVAAESAGRQVPIAFLERVKEDFIKRYGGGKAATVDADGLTREFGYVSSDYNG